MTNLEYDIKIAVAIKALRELRRIKQHIIANALNITQATYCRIEMGKIPITLGQIKVISKELNTSVFQILAIVEKDDMIDFKYEALSDILIKFVLMFETNGEEEKIISKNELDYIINKIKAHYELLRKN
ncbi:MAG: helix-turn-helix domain-containing protein [Bacteroidia bacterium]